MLTAEDIWPHGLNWSESFKVTLEYRTEVWKSRAGKEQRRSLRSMPRRVLDLSSTVRGADLRAFHRRLATKQTAQAVMPDPSRAVETAELMLTGDDTVALPYIPEWVLGGALVVAGKGGSLSLLEVESVSGTDVTFTGPTPVDLPAGTLLRAGVPGYFGDDLAANRPTNAVATIPVRFEGTPGAEPFADPPGPETTFNGREVFLKKPNWSTPIELTFHHETETLDYGRGVVARFVPEAFSARYWRASYVGRGVDDTMAVEHLFRRMQGQRGEFYMPTLENDLPLKTNVANGANSFVVAGTETAEAFDGDTVFKAVVVRLVDGSDHFFTVTSITQSGGDSVVHTGQTFPIAVDVEDVLMISWMPVWRFATDALSIEWVTDSVSKFSLSLTTLEDLTAE